MFEVAEGGFLDIDVTITDPDGNSLYKGERDGSGKLAFQAEKTGIYTYCFSNKMSTLTPKVVMFNFVMEEPSKTDGKDGARKLIKHIILQLNHDGTSGRDWGVLSKGIIGTSSRV